MTATAKKLWAKGYDLNPLIEAFEVGDDLSYDNRLVLPDVLGSIAHAAGLAKIGILDWEDFWALHAGLAQIAGLYEQGRFLLEQGDEDVHTKIENWLTANVGEPGKEIHTGRSRNDQVLVDLRLYTREAVLPVYRAVLSACESLHGLAERHEQTPMPGYTHMQRAMLSTVGVWAGSCLEALLDDLKLLDAAVDLSDQNPLGSAASYGVPLPLDRQYVSDLLGFKQVQNNVLYTQHGRGKFEGAIVQALVQVMLDLSKLAQDVLLFTTAEYGFFSLNESLLTGSSIMPQKKNLGAVELLRARGQVMLAYQQQILGILIGLPSGYNMDSQDTKRPFMDALDLAAQSAAVASLVVSQLEPNEERMQAACSPELFATDIAYDLVRGGTPFRDAYREVAAKVADLPGQDPRAHLEHRTHQGASGDLRLETSAAEISRRSSAIDARQEGLAAIASGLLSGERIGSR
jgi:argininosuccinate lyase